MEAIDLDQIKNRLVGSENTPHALLFLFLPIIVLAGAGWLYSFNFINASQQIFLVVFFGVMFLIVIISGAGFTYQNWGLLNGLLVGSAFSTGGMWMFWDHTISSVENIVMMIALGSVIGIVFGSLGAVVGYSLQEIF